MRSWLWLERSGLAPESGKARPWQLEKGIMEKGAKGEGIMAIVGKVCDKYPPSLPMTELLGTDEGLQAMMQFLHQSGAFKKRRT